MEFQPRTLTTLELGSVAYCYVHLLNPNRPTLLPYDVPSNHPSSYVLPPHRIWYGCMMGYLSLPVSDITGYKLSKMLGCVYICMVFLGEILEPALFDFYLDGTQQWFEIFILTGRWLLVFCHQLFHMVPLGMDFPIFESDHIHNRSLKRMRKFWPQELYLGRSTLCH